MIYRQGVRYNIPRLRVTKVTTYLSVVHHEQEIVKFRYAFEQEETGIRFVYSGVQLFLKEGQVIDARATIKREVDAFGFIRLSVFKRIDIKQGELGL